MICGFSGQSSCRCWSLFFLVVLSWLVRVGATSIDGEEEDLTEKTHEIENYDHLLEGYEKMYIYTKQSQLLPTNSTIVITRLDPQDGSGSLHQVLNVEFHTCAMMNCPSTNNIGIPWSEVKQDIHYQQHAQSRLHVFHHPRPNPRLWIPQIHSIWYYSKALEKKIPVNDYKTQNRIHQSVCDPELNECPPRCHHPLKWDSSDGMCKQLAIADPLQGEEEL